MKKYDIHLILCAIEGGIIGIIDSLIWWKIDKNHKVFKTLRSSIALPLAVFGVCYKFADEHEKFNYKLIDGVSKRIGKTK